MHEPDYKVGGFSQPALDGTTRQVAGAEQHGGDLWGPESAHQAAVEQGLQYREPVPPKHCLAGGYKLPIHPGWHGAHCGV